MARVRFTREAKDHKEVLRNPCNKQSHRIAVTLPGSGME